MTTLQVAPGHEIFACNLRSSHVMILNAGGFPGARHADFRVRLQRMRSWIRSSDLRRPESRVPQVPQQEAGAAALGVRGFGERLVQRLAFDGRLRQLWGSPRTGLMLDAGSQLSHCI